MPSCAGISASSGSSRTSDRATQLGTALAGDALDTHAAEVGLRLAQRLKFMRLAELHVDSVTTDGPWLCGRHKHAHGTRVKTSARELARSGLSAAASSSAVEARDHLDIGAFSALTVHTNAAATICRSGAVRASFGILWSGAGDQQVCALSITLTVPSDSHFAVAVLANRAFRRFTVELGRCLFAARHFIVFFVQSIN